MIKISTFLCLVRSQIKVRENSLVMVFTEVKWFDKGVLLFDFILILIFKK